MSTTTALITGIIIGAVLIDFLWAWKFGIPQLFWNRLKFACHKFLSKVKN